jgi:uncharacterized C2H2 Zn-finger protein
MEKVQCGVCEKFFINDDYLDKHINKEHAIYKPVPNKRKRYGLVWDKNETIKSK